MQKSLNSPMLALVIMLDDKETRKLYQGSQTKEKVRKARP